MFLFVKIFCQLQRKRVIENKPAFGGTQGKAFSSQDFRYRKFKVVNAFSKYIHITNYKFKKKRIINLMEFFKMHIFLGAK